MPDKITNLNIEGLRKAVDVNSVVLFFKPWCVHCRHFEPVYQKFIEKAQSELPHVKVRAIDYDKHGREIQQTLLGVERYSVPIAEAIDGVPTVLFFHEHGATRKYTGPRTVPSLMETATQFFTPIP